MTIAPDAPSIFTQIPALPMRSSLLDRLVGAFIARRQRNRLAATYAGLMSVDDHILSDLGVTRHDILRLHEDLFRP